MSCKTKWDRDFLNENFDKSFITKQYKKHREDILFEREIGMLQATQPYVEKEIKIENITNNLNALKREYEEKIKTLEEELIKAKTNSTTSEKRKFIRKCPNNECQGFLSSSLKCELCKCWACSDCREMIGFTIDEKNNHECNKDILESVKLFEKDSKPCPKCAALICKTEGCDQMFCVECHTAFSWKTLKIESGVIHNPHYYEYQRRINNGIVFRNPMEIQCGRELDLNFINMLIEIFEPELPKGWKKKQKTRMVFNTEMTYVVYISSRGKETTLHPGGVDEFVNICRKVTHIRHINQPRFRQIDRLNNNLQLRIDYMRNKIDKEKFKKTIQKNEKENLKRREINNILGMFISTITDLFYRLVETRDRGIKKEMDELRKYTNDCLKRISKTYNCKMYHIDDLYNFI
jgi:hypothetical protein